MPMKSVVFPFSLSRLLIATAVAVAWVAVIPLGAFDAVAQDKDKAKKDEKKEEKKAEEEKGLPAGHSNHGEAFNEGPRQKAYLMGGTGNVTFPATCSKPIVQKFINQGLGQLHGFWFFEAERFSAGGGDRSRVCHCLLGNGDGQHQQRQAGQGFYRAGRQA